MAVVTPDGRIWGIKGSVSEIGMVTLNQPHFVTTLEECFTIGAPHIMGLPLTGRDFDQYEDSGWIVNCTYGGLDKSFDSSQAREVWEWDSSFSEEPIEAHPKIKDLLYKYGGREENGEVSFPLTYHPKRNIPSPLALKKQMVRSQDPKPNPMYGKKTYLSFHAVAKRSYASFHLPTDYRDKIGRVLKSLPGRNGRALARMHDSDKGDWLVMPPKVSQQGNGYEIQEEYLLNLDGWPADLYEDIIRL